MNRFDPPTAHDGCRAFLKAQFAGMGCDITVSTARPVVPSPYGEEDWRCPHGTTFWTEPTSEQMLAWAEAGTP